jgi:hypothetical protein
LKSDFNNTITELLQYDAVGGASSKAIVRTQWFDEDSSTWTDFEDVEGRTLELSSINQRYLSYSFMPPVKRMSLTLNNFGQVYSTGSGDEKASILKKNLLIRCWSGFELTAAQEFDAVSDFDNNTKKVHVKKIGSKLFSDIASYTGTVTDAAELSLYGGTTYGATTYSPLGYYQKLETLINGEQTFSIVKINANSSNFDFKYRVSPFADFSGSVWSTFSDIVSGLNTKNISAGINDDYLEYLIRFKAPQWGTADFISTVTLTKADKQFLFKRGIFVADEPQFSNTKVTVQARDYLKKALETEINMPDMSSTTNIGTAVSFVLDRCNIPYDVSNWDLTSTTITVNGTLHEQLNNKSGWKILDLLMDAQNAGNDDWRLKTEEDGGMSLKKVPTDREADWSAHYFFNIENVNKNFDSDKQLQRVTMMNKDFIVDPEARLKTVSGTAGSTLHVTYGTTAVYVRYTDTLGAILTETDRSNTAIDFSMNSGDAYDIELFGCTPKNALTDEIFAERGNAQNIIKNDGSTYKRVNVFMDQAMAEDFTDFIIGLNGDPKKKVTLSMVSNPLIELNDNIVVFDLYTYTDDIYNLQSIREAWNDPSLKDTWILQDRGINLDPFIWDRNGLFSGVNDLKYDVGLVWDQDIDINATADSQDYDFLKSINMVGGI